MASKKFTALFATDGGRPAPGDVVELGASVHPSEFRGCPAVVTEVFEAHCTVVVLDVNKRFVIGECWPSLHDVDIQCSSWRLNSRVVLSGLKGPRTSHLNGFSGRVVAHPKQGHVIFVSKPSDPQRPELTLCVRFDDPVAAGQKSAVLDARFFTPYAAHVQKVTGDLSMLGAALGSSTSLSATPRPEIEVTKQVDNVDQTLAKEQKLRLAVEERLDKSCTELRRDVNDSLKADAANVTRGLEKASKAAHGETQDLHKKTLSEMEVTKQVDTIDETLQKEQKTRIPVEDRLDKTCGELRCDINKSLKEIRKEINLLMGLPRNADFKPPSRDEEMIQFRPNGDGPVPGYARPLMTDEDGDEGHEFFVEDLTGDLVTKGPTSLEETDCWYSVLHKPAMVLRAKPDVKEFRDQREKMCNEQVTSKCLAQHEANLTAAQKACEEEAGTTFSTCVDDGMTAKETAEKAACATATKTECDEECANSCQVDKLVACLDELKTDFDVTEHFCTDFWKLLHESSEVDPITGDPIVLLAAKAH